MAAVALVSVIATAAVGLAGIGAGLWTARDGRRQAERMAREGRNYEARRELYVDVLAYFHRMTLFMARTEPFVALPDPPAPPEMPSEEDGIRLGAMTSALGSSALNDAVDACLDAFRQWRASVGIYLGTRAHLGESDQQAVSARMSMHTWSERYDGAVGDLERLVRQELQPPT